MAEYGNYSIRAMDASHSLIFHAEQFGENDWRYSSSDMAGIAIGDRRNIISALAHYVGSGKITLVESPTEKIGLFIDAAGNTWLRDKYLSCAEWLQVIIPVAMPLTAAPPAPVPDIRSGWNAE